MCLCPAGAGLDPGVQSLSVPDEPASDSAHRSKRRHRCSVCGREFSRPSRLVDHMTAHTGEKPYSCSLCSKRFTKKINVAVHQRVHTGEKPYSCPDCGVSYAQLSCLRRHRLGHAAEKPHCCSVCGRGFVQRRHLVQHERTHTGERPFLCSLCPKSFASRTGLVDHQKTHTGQNLYSSPPEGAAVHLWRLRPRVRPSVAAEGAHALSHRREAVPVRRLHEALLCAQSAEEASGDPRQGRVQHRRR
uniref:C2H2-type domain-containing protein n=1 Tax=Pundamilia nyererei TaxID=303518 RepID=A0A3B4GC41_9CICH